MDLFGIVKRRELLKAALKREIEREIQPSSRTYLQGWQEKDEREGRTPRVSYAALEAVYKKESWVRACLTEDALLYTSAGEFKNINKLSLEDKVINKDGKFSNISETMELKYTGDLYEFERWFGPAYKIKATADHPFLVFSSNKLIWKKAKDITDSDLLVEAIYKDEKDLDSYELHITNEHKKTIKKYVDYYKEVPINEETMKIIGYFLAEGSTSGKKQTDFCFGSTKQEKEYVEELCGAVSNSLGYKLNVRQDTAYNRTNIISHSRTLKEFLSQFGTRAWNKKIPNWVLSLPNHKTKELLKAFWFGDGCSTYKKEANFDSTSLALLEGIRILLLRHGIVSSIRKSYDGDNSNMVIGNYVAKRRHSLYRLSVYGKNLENLMLLFGINVDYTKRTSNNSFIKDNLVFYKIKNIKKLQVSNINVYNIEVPDTNSYVVNGIISHNCIDVITRTATSNGYRLLAKDTAEQVDPKSAKYEPILNLLERPNPYDTFEELLSEICTDLHIYGDAYVEIVKDKRGTPVALYNIYAPSLRVQVDEHGTVEGYIQKPMGILSGGSTAVEFKPDEVAHFRLPNPGNEVYGLSPIESLDIVIETDLYAQDYNLHFFKNHAVPRLHVDLANCTLPQLKRVREYFNREFKGSSNAHKTIVTEGGAVIKPIGTSPNDMEFLNQRKFSRDEICLLGNTEIITKGGLKEIKDIKVGDLVLTHTGNFRKVLTISDRSYKGAMYELGIKGFEPITITPNHPVLTLEGKSSRNHKLEYNNELNWKQVEDVICRKKKSNNKHYSRKGFDNMMFPTIKFNNIPSRIDLKEFCSCNVKFDNEYIWKDNPNSKKIKRFISLNSDFGKLIGYFLAEGFTSDHQLYLSFNINEKEYINDVINLFNIIFDIDVSYTEKVKNNVGLLTINSSILNEFFKCFGHLAHNKKIAPWCYDGSEEFFSALLEGLFNGDACYREDRTTYTSVSKELTWQVRLLLFSFGKYASLHMVDGDVNATIMGRKVNAKNSYELSFTNNKIGPSSVITTNEYVSSFVNLKNKIYKNTKVYNIEVEEDNSYVTLSGIVHNCSVFGVPPMKLGIFEDVNRASSKEADKSFKSEKIIPLQRMIAKKINSDIIMQFDKIGDDVSLAFVEVDLRDAKEQAEIDAINIKSGVLTKDEVRKKRGLAPLEVEEDKETEEEEVE